MKGKQQPTKEQIPEVLRFIESAGSIPNALKAIQNNADNVPERFRGAKNNVSTKDSRISPMNL
ncbi:hypothetical protein [Lysinibacillus fusiformis]|uniref:hypothetical protein n=1 Tax=Lysinibacillus fusiformis TaxID=28031 RepID=UPI003016346F